MRRGFYTARTRKGDAADWLKVFVVPSAHSMIANVPQELRTPPVPTDALHVQNVIVRVRVKLPKTTSGIV